MNRMNSLGPLLLLLVVTGCANPIEEIDETVDCTDLCNRYRDCYDSSYDTAACRGRCEELADGADPGAANDCDACLDPRACTEAFACVDACYGLLP